MPTSLTCLCIFCGQDTQDRMRFQHQVLAEAAVGADEMVYDYSVCGDCYKLVSPFVLFPLHFVLHTGLFRPPKPKE